MLSSSLYTVLKLSKITYFDYFSMFSFRYESVGLFSYDKNQNIFLYLMLKFEIHAFLESNGYWLSFLKNKNEKKNWLYFGYPSQHLKNPDPETISFWIDSVEAYSFGKLNLTDFKSVFWPWLDVWIRWVKMFVSFFNC